MPGVKSYTRALKMLGESARSRLDNILDADPGMAKVLNEYGMTHAATSEYPIAVIQPEDYLRMARKHDRDASDEYNRGALLDRIKMQQPTGRHLDMYSPDTMPDFLHGYMRTNPYANSFDIYRHKGIGLPRGFDVRHGVDEMSDADDPTIDMGGLPMLGFARRSQDTFNVLSHEGRGRNAFASYTDSAVPTQMIEHTAIIPEDWYVPYENAPSILNRMGQSKTQQAKAWDKMQNNEPVPLTTHGEMSREEALDYLTRASKFVPEDYIRYARGPDGRAVPDEEDAPRMRWKAPVFADGGSVQDNSSERAMHFWSDSARDNTGFKRYGSLAMRGLTPAATSYNEETDRLERGPGLIDDLTGMGLDIGDIMHSLSDLSASHGLRAPALDAVGMLGQGASWLADKTGLRKSLDRRNALLEMSRHAYTPETFGERVAEGTVANLPYAAALGIGMLPERMTALLARYGIKPAASALGSEALMSTATGAFPEQTLEERAKAGDTDAQIELSQLQSQDFVTRR